MVHRKIISVLLVVLFCSGMLSACSGTGSGTAELSSSAHVEGSIFGGKADDSLAVTAVFNPDWLTKEDNTVYNPDLAAFSALLCADSYFREKDLAKGTQNRVLLDGTDPENYSFTSFLDAFGFTVTRHVESYKEKNYETDTNDSVTMNLGYCPVSDRFDIFVVAVRGCFSAGEWMSVFDAGADSPLYESITGEHPEWTDRSVHKGIDVAANRAYDLVREFIGENADPSRTTCILLTGHSRGSAIAGVLGARFEKDPDIRSYTYTFNTAVATTDPSAGDYRTIFNVFDSGDLFTDIMPFGKENFYHFGRDMSAEISGTDEIRKTISELKGRDDYVSLEEEQILEYRQLFGSRFPDRASLFEFKNRTESFENREAAESRYEELRSVISAETGFGLEGFCLLQDIVTGPDDRYEVSMDYCDAAVLFSLGKILTYGETAAAAVKSVFRNDIEACEIADFFMERSASISGGHLLSNSYVLSQYIGKKGL